MPPEEVIGTTKTPLTYWQKLVWLTFNPSGDSKVNDLKKSYANIIDMLNDSRSLQSENSEYQRYISIAITEAQTAQMWAVKAVTAL